MFGDTDIGWDHEVTIGKKKFQSGDIHNTGTTSKP